MVLTPSSMMPLGTTMPDFRLPEPAEDKQRSHEELRGEKGLLVMFICNHCPYVLHIEQGLIDFGRDYADRGIGIVAISSNDAQNYPQDAPKKIAERSVQKNYPFPYLYDESQQTAKDFQAACTPDFFLFDADLQCIYRGRFDDSRPGSDTPVSGTDLRNAVDAALAGRRPEADQQASIGCNIKWRDND